MEKPKICLSGNGLSKMGPVVAEIWHGPKKL